MVSSLRGLSLKRYSTRLSFVSVYIYIYFCMDRLSLLIHSKVTGKLWKPIVLGKNSPPISYLFFVDELFLFVEAETDQAQVIQ